ncbi:MAG: glycosyltransferase family 87 protein [Bacteroidota bacterium]
MTRARRLASSAAPLTSRTRTALVALAALIVVGALGAIGAVSVGKQLRSGNDFPIYWGAARTLAAGGSPYDVASGLHGYVYPPFLALVLIPVGALPLGVAAWIWFVLSAAAAALACRVALRLVRRGWGPGGLARWALAAWLPLAGLAADNAALGQANLILLALGVAGSAELLRRRDLRGGGLIGLAAAVKPHLALLLVPGLLRGRWRLAAGSAAALLLAGAVLPLAVVGPARTATLWREWGEKVMVPAREGTLQGSTVWDQSPQAGLRRLLVDAPAFDRTGVHVASLGPEAFGLVSRAWSALAGAILIAVWGFAPRRDDPRAELLDQGLAFTGTLLLVGYSLKAHFVALLLPLAIATALARGRKGGIAVVAAADLLILLGNPGIAGRTVSNWCLAYSCITAATLLLAGFLAVRRLRLTPPRRAER